MTDVAEAQAKAVKFVAEQLHAAHTASNLRTLLHGCEVERVNDPDTITDPDGHQITVADDYAANATTVLIIDGARIDLDDQDVARLCYRLLRRLTRDNPDVHWRFRAACDDLRDVQGGGF